MVVLFVAAVFCFAVSHAFTVNVRAAADGDNMPSYRVSIPAHEFVDVRYFTSRYDAADGATEIILEYKVIESDGKHNVFGLSAFDDKGTKADFYSEIVGPVAALNKYYDVNVSKYVATYKLDGTYASLVSYDSQGGATTLIETGVDIEGSQMYGKEPLTVSKAGILYGSYAWEAAFDVKCYDDTGKDLGITSGRGNIYVDGMISEPYGAASLTSFSENDALISNGSLNLTPKGLDESVVYFTESDELESRGAQGSVLAIERPDEINSAVAVQFGRTLTAEDIALGGDLVVRAWVYAPDGWTENCRAFPFDADGTTDMSNPSPVIFEHLTHATYNAGVFIDIVIENEDLSLLTDKEGDIKGLQLSIGDFGTNAGTADWTFYFDEIFYVRPVTVNFFDADGEKIATEQLNSGYSIEEQTDVVPPEIDGKVAVGWTLSSDGSGFYDSSEIGYKESEINLYAKYLTPTESDEFYGCYASENNGKYFFLNSDGSITDDVDALEYSTFVAGADGTILFDGRSAAAVVSGVLTVGGVEYEKQDTVFSVEYRLEDKLYAQINVPEGFSALELVLDQTDFNFNCWTADGEEYDFGAVTKDIILTADMTVNEISSDGYEDFLNAYLNEDSNIIYIVSENGEGYELIKVENGAAQSVGQCKVTAGFKLYVEGNIYSFEPISIGDNYVGPLSLEIDGDVYWIIPDEYTVTLHYNDAEKKTDTFTVTKEDNYLFAKPQDPTRDGYTFKGWALGTGEIYNFDSAVTREIELYAVWENNTEYTGSGCDSSLGGAGLIAGAVLLSVAAVIIYKKNRSLV